MKKRTHFEFDGSTGYSYICKKYGESRLSFEIHIRDSDEATDVLHFGVDASNGRSMYRSLGRALVEIDRELGLDCVKGAYDEFKDELESAESEE